MPERAPGSREEDAWLSDEQLTKCTPADEAEGFASPTPTQMVSNGEYMPYPQTDKQRQVEARIKELADSASKKLGISRRKFLAGTGGMAAALLAMNEVFGRFFDVRPIDMFESEAFAASGPPQNLFVLDDQTHMVRFTQTQGRSLRAIAQGPGPASTAAGFLRNPNNPTGALDELGNAWTPWNPLLGQTPNTGSEFHLAKYIQRFFLESQVTVSILSNANLGSIPVAGGTTNPPPRNIPESPGTSRSSESTRASGTSACIKAWRRGRPTSPSAATRRTSRRRQGIGRSSTSSSTTPASATGSSISTLSKRSGPDRRGSSRERKCRTSAGRRSSPSCPRRSGTCTPSSARPSLDRSSRSPRCGRISSASS